MKTPFKNLVASSLFLLAVHTGATAATPAPEFIQLTGWLNSAPLSIASQRGKVVLVEFWTYSCINCLRNLPHVSKWHDQYKAQGLSVVGIHTPEYPFEKEPRNVAAAVKRLDVHYPVAQDNQYATWNAFSNKYWPAVYLIDRKGTIRYQHFGEGRYKETDQAIRQLLAEE